MIYVAGPYSHQDEETRILRYRILTAYTASLIQQGFIVYSPITHNHPIASEYSLPTGWTYWQKSDSFFVCVAKELHVCQIQGWTKSEGVNREMELATKFDTPIVYVGETQLHRICPHLI